MAAVDGNQELADAGHALGTGSLTVRLSVLAFSKRAARLCSTEQKRPQAKLSGLDNASNDKRDATSGYRRTSGPFRRSRWSIRSVAIPAMPGSPTAEAHRHRDHFEGSQTR